MEHTPQTVVFQPILHNPLHSGLLVFSDQLPLPSPEAGSSGLQRKSNLKKSPSSSFPTRSVGWETPLITTRFIPSRNNSSEEEETLEGYGTMVPTKSGESSEKVIDWTISGSMSKNESSLHKDAIFFELGTSPTPSQSRLRSSGPLCFSRVKSSFFSSAEVLCTRVNLVHLQEAIVPGAQPLLHNLPSRPTPGTYCSPTRPSVLPPTPSKKAATRSTITSSPVIFSTIANIPSRFPEVDDLGIGAKRKLGTDTNKRPSKVARPDENTITIGSIDTLSHPNTSDFPNFKTVVHQLVRLNSRSRSNSPSGGEHGLHDDDGSARGNDGDSDDLFGDHEVMEFEPMSVEDDVAVPERQLSVAFTSESSLLISEPEPKIVDPEKAVPQTQRPRRPLNSIIVVNWMNELRRFQDLQKEKKLSWQCQDQLYDILKEINKERDNTYLTPKELARTNLGKIMKEIGRTKEFERRTWQLAREIVKFWRQVCREAESSLNRIESPGL